jgi:hypothetical protein
METIPDVAIDRQHPQIALLRLFELVHRLERAPAQRQGEALGFPLLHALECVACPAKMTLGQRYVVVGLLNLPVSHGSAAQ